MIKKFFNNIANEWEENITAAERERLNTLFKTKIPAVEGPVLDLGCGTGILVPLLWVSSHQVLPLVEMDIASAMLNINRHNNPSSEGIYQVGGAGQKMPFRAESFSTVICFQSFPHFKKEDEVVKEISRVLKPQGKLIILHLTGHRQLNEIHQKIGGIVKDHVLLPVQELAAGLQSAGFKNILSEEEHSLYLYVGRKED